MGSRFGHHLVSEAYRDVMLARNAKLHTDFAELRARWGRFDLRTPEWQVAASMARASSVFNALEQHFEAQ